MKVAASQKYPLYSFNVSKCGNFFSKRAFIFETAQVLFSGVSSPLLQDGDVRLQPHGRGRRVLCLCRGTRLAGGEEGSHKVSKVFRQAAALQSQK